MAQIQEAALHLLSVPLCCRYSPLRRGFSFQRPHYPPAGGCNLCERVGSGAARPTTSQQAIPFVNGILASTTLSAACQAGQSPQAYTAQGRGFGRVPPYRGISSHCVVAQPFVQDVLCGVDVAVVSRSVLRASPFSDVKVFQRCVTSAAVGTNLAGGKIQRYIDYGLAVPFGLVIQLPEKLIPTSVAH